MSAGANGERRIYSRFKPQEGTFAALSMSHSDVVLRMGEVTDISRGGLALDYLADADEPDGLSSVRIFGRSCLAAPTEEIPCKIVYDRSLGTKSWSLLPMRRCGIEFGPLSSDQKRQIDYVIANCTTGVVFERVSHGFNSNS